MSAPVKPGIKPLKDDVRQVPAKPTVQRRPSSVYNMTRSMTIASPDASSHENSMTTSLYTGSVSTAKQESKEINHSNEVPPLARQPPTVLPKKPAIGAHVLPKIESTGADGGPPLVKQRRPPLEKKRKAIFFCFVFRKKINKISSSSASVLPRTPSIDQPSSAADPVDSSTNIDDSSEQYKRMMISLIPRMFVSEICIFSFSNVSKTAYTNVS